MNKKFFSILMLTALLVSASSARLLADGETAGDVAGGMGSKFGRGLLNVISSPAEIPCTMRDDIQSSGAAAGTFTGLGKGLAFFVRRALVGVCEVGTFMIPMPATLPTVCTKPEAAQQGA